MGGGGRDRGRERRGDERVIERGEREREKRETR